MKPWNRFFSLGVNTYKTCFSPFSSTSLLCHTPTLITVKQMLLKGEHMSNLPVSVHLDIKTACESVACNVDQNNRVEISITLPLHHHKFISEWMIACMEDPANARYAVGNFTLMYPTHLSTDALENRCFVTLSATLTSENIIRKIESK